MKYFCRPMNVLNISLSLVVGLGIILAALYFTGNLIPVPSSPQSLLITPEIHSKLQETNLPFSSEQWANIFQLISKGINDDTNFVGYYGSAELPQYDGVTNGLKVGMYGARTGNATNTFPSTDILFANYGTTKETLGYLPTSGNQNTFINNINLLQGDVKWQSATWETLTSVFLLPTITILSSGAKGFPLSPLTVATVLDCSINQGLSATSQLVSRCLIVANGIEDDFLTAFLYAREQIVKQPSFPFNAPLNALNIINMYTILKNTNHKSLEDCQSDIDSVTSWRRVTSFTEEQ